MSLEASLGTVAVILAACAAGCASTSDLVDGGKAVGGIVTSRLSLPLGPRVSVRPHPWPTGIHIEGTFDVP